MTVSQRLFLAIAQFAPSLHVLMHLGDLSDRAENFNVYVRAVRRIIDAWD